MTELNSATPPQPVETCFHVFDRQLAAQVWGSEQGFPIIALHGWLDNAASFYQLAPQLIEQSPIPLRIIALDMAGHGRSDYRCGGIPYNLWQEVADVFAVADSQGWPQFSLIGHSRGANVSLLCAGTFPERIGDLLLIDGLWPEPVPAEKAPEVLARSISDMAGGGRNRSRVYPSQAQMIKALQGAQWPLTETAASQMVARGSKVVAGGYSWCADPLLRASSAVKFNREQLLAFATRVKARVMLIMADQGLAPLLSTFREDLQSIADLTVVELQGSHHLHMEPEAAKQITELFISIMKSDEEGCT